VGIYIGEVIKILMELIILNKPVLGVPMGDPAGIGPEIILKALTNEEVYDKSNPVIIGDFNVLSSIADIIGIKFKLNNIKCVEEAEFKFGTIDILPINNMNLSDLDYGVVNAKCGKAAYEYIEASIGLAQSGKLDAVVTTPINKEAVKGANINFLGHTEMFASLTNTKNPITMFQVHELRVFFLSRHLSLKEACDYVKKDNIIKIMKKCINSIDLLGIENRKIAIAGLNPHSSDNGMFGREELDEIIPAIEELNKLGHDVLGPIPADCVFHQALNGKYDAVLSLYHDQGHVATKMVDFEKTIAFTIGLPFLRTSVDHGTAFDIAGKGIASAKSMEEAIFYAAKHALRYKLLYNDIGWNKY